MKTRILFVLAIALMLSTACQAVSPAGQEQLSGSEWVLVSINADSNLVGNPITLAFEDGEVSGFASCNVYGGSFQVKGEALTMGALARTEMYCMEPEGVMDQEYRYLEILGAAEKFLLSEGGLTIMGAGNELVFLSQDQISAVITATEDVDTQPQATEIPATPSPSPTPELALPAGWQEYKDGIVGVGIYLPDTWQVHSAGMIAGEYAVFQSYPEDKYTGGEARDPEDTKCDLNLNPSIGNLAELIGNWESDSRATILSDQEFTLRSGLAGRRFEIDNMGLARVYGVEFDSGLVLLTCFGDFSIVDEIASWLHD